MGLYSEGQDSVPEMASMALGAHHSNNWQKTQETKAGRA